MASRPRLSAGDRRPFERRTSRVRPCFLVAIFTVLGACRGERRQSAEAPLPPSVAPSASAASAAPSTATVDWYRNPSEGCDFDTTRAHPDALALVREFVDRDARGEYALGSEWLPGAVVCPGQLPGPDGFTAIDTVEVLSAQAILRADSAWVPVRYELLGDASALVFQPTEVARTRVDTFVVARTAYGWRVVAPDMPMRIRASVALQWNWLADSTKSKLRRAAESARAARARDG